MESEMTGNTSQFLTEWTIMRKIGKCIVVIAQPLDQATGGSISCILMVI
jgi:hypothetical protein